MSIDEAPQAEDGGPVRRAGPFGLSAAVDTLLEQVRSMADQEPYSVGTAALGDELTRVQQGMDALAGVAARWTAAFADQDGPSDAGAGSLAAWLRRELRVTGYEAAKRVQRARVLASLPATAKALTMGDINVGHVDVLARAVNTLGSATVAQAEPILLPVALESDPDGLGLVTQRLRDTLDPDAADEAYVRALERRDITVTKTGDLYQLQGVLDPVTGELLKTALYGLSRPLSANDLRTAGQRRVDGLRTMCDERLHHGVPTDRGFRPHLFVTVTADRLIGYGSRRHEPAALHGFGTIGDVLLGQLGCEADQTEITVAPDGSVLDVGRTKRLATPKQRIAVFTEQGGVCAAPGCRNAHLEVHHRVWWSHGGSTNLRDLAGYCSRCHHLLHLGLLVLKPDGDGGWTHQDQRGRTLRDRWRDAEGLARDHINAFAEAVLNGKDADLSRRRRRRRHRR